MLEHQKRQFDHDTSAHPDIVSLSRTERLKHFGLHFSKYVGRLARGSIDPAPYEQTIADSFLICLSSANALNLKLEAAALREIDRYAFFIDFASSVGTYCDGIEKIDHAEDNCFSLAKNSNQEIFSLLLAHSCFEGIDIFSEAEKRRLVVRKRAFYVED